MCANVLKKGTSVNLTMYTPSEQKWKATWNCFVQPGTKNKKVPGLTKLLKTMFYKQYSFKNATEGVALGRSNNEVKKSVLAERKAKGGRGAGRVSGKKLQQKGMQMGNELDDELLVLTRWLVESGEKVSMMEALTNLIQKNGVKFSTDTVRIWAALDKMNLRPIGSQVIVWSARMNVATPLDLLCLNTDTDELVDVQIKRGYNGYYEKHTKTPMSMPFQMLNDSPYYQHQIQILYEWIMMRESFVGPKKVEMDAVVLRVDNEGVTKYPLARELMAWAEPAMMVMQNRKMLLKVRKETKKVADKILKALPKAAPKTESQSSSSAKPKVKFNNKSVAIKKKKKADAKA